MSNQPLSKPHESTISLLNEAIMAHLNPEGKKPEEIERFKGAIDFAVSFIRVTAFAPETISSLVYELHQIIATIKSRDDRHRDGLENELTKLVRELGSRIEKTKEDAKK